MHRIQRRTVFGLLVVVVSLGVMLFVYLATPPQTDAAGKTGNPPRVVNTPPAASVSTKVSVSSALRSGTFTTDRYLNIPPNFTISVYTRISGARFTAIAPNGDLLVSDPSDGKVVLVRPNPNGDPFVSDFVTSLRKPHDIVFHSVNGTMYVYISETNQINRFIYTNGDTTAHDRQIIITGLPDSSTPELHGAYGHELKNIALDATDTLYVAISSTCNACTEDTVSTPVRGAIYRYNADGSNGRLFARGLRNPEGLAMLPGTNVLWVAVNNRDNIEYPFQDSTGNYQKVIPSYVDNHPPEEFTQVRDGGNYGWPFCNPNPDTANGYDTMPFDRDVQFNADGAQLNCTTADRTTKGIQAHSAPLGLTFLQNTAFPALYRTGAVIGLHGSWNRTVPTGAKVIYFPWDSTTQTPGAQEDLVSGWQDSAGNRWGRPVDMAVDLQGNMLISDDLSGTIYKLSYNAPPATPTPVPPTATPLPPTATPPAGGQGTGLQAQYFSDQNLNTPVLNRTDATVNFDWGTSAPAPSVPADHFSVRWTGQVQPRYGETYTFTTTSDDGVRVWVNGQKIIDNWTDHAATTNSGTLTLSAGQKYALTLEFYENGGLATAKLAWSSPHQAQEIVPQSQLYPAALAPATALFVVGTTALTSGDSAVQTRLHSLGFTVTIKDGVSVTAADATGKTLVVISSTVLSSDVNTKFRTVAVPVVTWEQNLMDDLGMAADTDHGTTQGQTQVTVTSNPLTAGTGLSGTVTATTTGAVFTWVKPNANATIAATLPTDPTKAVIFGYTAQTAMVGLTAPARRVGIFLDDATATNLTANGWALFDAAIRWAAATL